MDAATPLDTTKAKKRKPARMKANTPRKETAPKGTRAKLEAAAMSGVAKRSERMEVRLTKAEKARIHAKAKKTRRTVTSLISEAIEKIR